MSLRKLLILLSLLIAPLGMVRAADDIAITAALTTSTGQKTMVALNREQRLYDVVVTRAEPAIAFTVKNVSKHDVGLNNQKLPSVAVPGRLVLTASWKWGDPLPAMAPPPIDYDMPAPGNPIPEPMILKPGESKVYVVPISLRVDGLTEARMKGDVVLFWYFEAFDELTKKDVGNAGGWFDLPKANSR